MIRILAFEFLSSKCPDLYHSCCYIGQMREIESDSVRERIYFKRKRKLCRNASTPGNLSTGLHGDTGAGVPPLTKDSELSNQILKIYDKWHVELPTLLLLYYLLLSGIGRLIRTIFGCPI